MKRLDIMNKTRQTKPPYKDNESILEKLKEYAGKSSFCCINGRRDLELCGCCGLIGYKDNEIGVRLCDGYVFIYGKGLRIGNYFGGRMLISGEIDSVRLCCKEDGI